MPTMLRNINIKIKTLVSPKYLYLKKFDIFAEDVVIDLGANVGEISEYFIHKGAKVYAYEPNAFAFQVLEKRLKKKANAHLYNLAVSNYTGPSKLWLHKQHKEGEIKFSQAGSLAQEKTNLSEDYIPVNVIDIAEVLAPHNHIKILKIDIEGGEYDIMPTVFQHIKKIDHVLLETHGTKNPAFREREAQLLKQVEEYKGKILTDWF
jgi:FkbM family methyltransferase